MVAPQTILVRYCRFEQSVRGRQTTQDMHNAAIATAVAEQATDAA
jgi:hypothetical protein